LPRRGPAAYIRSITLEGESHPMLRTLCLSLVAVLAASLLRAEDPPAKLNSPPKGFTALFNGKNLDGWQICIPIVERNALKAKGGDSYDKAVEAANRKHLKEWSVKEGVIHYTGKGFSLQTVKDYADFELYLDWKIAKNGDSGLYLRGQPQVQIWDSDNTPGARGVDKSSGSGGLWNNPLPAEAAKSKDDKVILEAGKKIGKIPLVKADNPVGEWNTFHIVMRDDIATVRLNGKLVVDKCKLPNYFERGKPLPTTGPIELQHHGDPLWFRNIYIKELKAEE
jgi:hypothetical protein